MAYSKGFGSFTPHVLADIFRVDWKEKPLSDPTLRGCGDRLAAGLAVELVLWPSRFCRRVSVDLPETASGDAEALARHVFEQQPAWIAMLMSIRDRLVRPFGLKRAADLQSGGGDRISIFRVFDRDQDEIILGEDDRHLDLSVSVLVQSASKGRRRRLIVTTLVFYNRPLGCTYIALIAPFHRLVVRASLDRAQKLGWPRLSDHREVGSKEEFLINGRTVDATYLQGATVPLKVTGLPGISMRFGTSREGLPINVQIVGSWLAESTILAVALRLESVSTVRHLHPDL